MLAAATLTTAPDLGVAAVFSTLFLAAATAAAVAAVPATWFGQASSLSLPGTGLRSFACWLGLLAFCYATVLSMLGKRARLAALLLRRAREEVCLPGLLVHPCTHLSIHIHPSIHR